MVSQELTQGTAPVADATSAKAVKGDNPLKASGKAVREQMTDEEKAIEGSKSNTIAFVNSIGADNMPVTIGNVPGKKTVGFRFRNVGDAPIAVPVAPAISKKPYEADITGNTRTVNAGEEFVLNCVETGILISQIEYAGRFSGGEKTVHLILKSQKESALPLVTLKADTGNVKDGMVVIGADKDADGNTVLAEEYKPSFEKFFAKRVRPQREAKKENTYAINAAAFRQALQGLSK